MREKEIKNLQDLSAQAETEYLIDFSKRLGYISEKDYEEIELLRCEAGKLLWSFYKKIAG